MKTLQHTKFSFEHIVLQPTSACNLNCSYCYLPDRRLKNEMSLELAERVAFVLESSINEFQRIVGIVWHSGEPLLIGAEKFEKLLQPFENLRKRGLINHYIQTNGTTINDKWCDIFEYYEFNIGVSIDGNEDMNFERVNWGNKDTTKHTLKGIEHLKRRGIDFAVIAVVGQHNIDKVSQFYNFFAEMGCSGLNINIEEKEGANLNNSEINYQQSLEFWQTLYSVWLSNPKIKIREITSVLAWADSVINENGNLIIANEKKHINLWPTISHNGDMVILSPEFISIVDLTERNKFIIGNVYHENILEIIKNADKIDYYKEWVKGNKKCFEECAYYSYCGGGQASNKYFENGSVNTTETMFCINTRKALIDAIF